MKKIMSSFLALVLVLTSFAFMPAKAEAASSWQTFGNAKVNSDGTISLSEGNTWSCGFYQYSKPINLREDITVEYEIRLSSSGKGKK